MRLALLTSVALLMFLGAPAVLADGNAQEQQVFERSILRIYIMENDRIAGGGTAVLTDKGLMTNYHIVQDVGTVYYKPRDFDKPREIAGQRSAVVVDRFGATRKVASWKMWGRADVVVLTLAKPAPGQWVPLKWGAMPKLGDRVRVAGFYGKSGLGSPRSGKLCYSTGWVEGIQMQWIQGQMYQIILSNAPIYKGLSGSPLLNDAGEVVAINAVVMLSGWPHTGSWRLPTK
jgi:S1-C subfamily serine protease